MCASIHIILLTKTYLHLMFNSSSLPPIYNTDYYSTARYNLNVTSILSYVGDKAAVQ